ncbi:MAG: PDDEXK nuclease domain-containing protein [Lentisphaeria bacterium]|nr:PDDEXK nuclease domain-containing protein [Lentisphaeria bacterium]
MQIAAERPLFDRVVSILEQARGNVVRTVNTNMVMAYWLIGREIVQELQDGEERAEYGKQVIEDLSIQLRTRYGKGFSTSNLWYFRQFYLAYEHRMEIPHPMGGELHISRAKGDISGDYRILHSAGGEFAQGFCSQLSWSHYRVLMAVENVEARDFYEREASEGGWSKRTLERQVHTQYYERSLHAQQPAKMIAEGRRLQKTPPSPTEILKNPYVLEFLGYPNFADVRESDVERAIITHLQRFLLELGTGFAFVARQKHIRIDEDDRFIDLVFYHCRLKFYLLIDLKIGKITHGDVGQMDGYVRMFDGLFAAPDDNPSIGLILCTEKCDTVARYSVLNDRKQIFASKYLPNLPTEEQLQREIQRERKLIEAAMAERKPIEAGGEED